MCPVFPTSQLPREGEQAVNINTKVNEIIKSSSALPSVKTGGRQKTIPGSSGFWGFVVYNIWW